MLAELAGLGRRSLVAWIVTEKCQATATCWEEPPGRYWTAPNSLSIAVSRFSQVQPLGFDGHLIIRRNRKMHGAKDIGTIDADFVLCITCCGFDSTSSMFLASFLPVFDFISTGLRFECRSRRFQDIACCSRQDLGLSASGCVSMGWILRCFSGRLQVSVFALGLHFEPC